MESLRSAAAHAMTAVVTFAMGDALGSAIATAPGVARPPQPRRSVPAVEPVPIPAEVLKAADPGRAGQHPGLRQHQPGRGQHHHRRLVDRLLRRRVDHRRLGLGVRHRPRRPHPHQLPRHRGGPTPVQVTLADGSAHEARVVGADASNDVAVIRIDVSRPTGSARSTSASRRASSSAQKVLALGNPFGLERTPDHRDHQQPRTARSRPRTAGRSRGSSRATRRSTPGNSGRGRS